MNCTEKEIEKNDSRLLPEEIPEQVIKASLRDSKTKLGSIIVVDNLVCPFLFAVVVASLWMELNYPIVDSFGSLCYLLRHADGSLLASSLFIWALSHCLELIFLLAITMDNLRYCRLYVSTIGPLMRSMIILTFVLVMWSCFKPLDNNSLTRYVIIVSSTIVLIANFFNYYLKTLSEHVHLLTALTVAQTFTA